MWVNGDYSVAIYPLVRTCPLAAQNSQGYDTKANHELAWRPYKKRRRSMLDTATLSCRLQVVNYAILVILRCVWCWRWPLTVCTRFFAL